MHQVIDPKTTTESYNEMWSIMICKGEKNYIILTLSFGCSNVLDIYKICVKEYYSIILIL